MIKKKRDEYKTAMENASESGWESRVTELPPEDVLFEVELEDMFEEDPTSWEDLAENEWKEYTSSQGETRDSTTGEVLDPAKVQEGCNEAIGFMSQMKVWDRVTREKAQQYPDGKIVGTRWFS